MSTTSRPDSRPTRVSSTQPLPHVPTVLVVGYPAPSAVQIVERLLSTDARPVVCVVPHGRLAEASAMHRGAQDSGRLRLIGGRADAPGLGLTDAAQHLLGTTEEIHAVAPAREIATGHIRDFADECPHLRRLTVVAHDEAPAPRSAWSLLSRAASSTTAALALGAAGMARVTMVVRAAAPWSGLLDVDLEVAFSRDDLERDLWPGLGMTA